MVERSGPREVVLGNLRIPEGTLECTSSLSLNDNGKELCLEVRYSSSGDRVAWDSRNDQFTDQ